MAYGLERGYFLHLQKEYFDRFSSLDPATATSAKTWPAAISVIFSVCVNRTRHDLTHIR